MALFGSPYNFRPLRELADDSHIPFGSDLPFAIYPVIKKTKGWDRELRWLIRNGQGHRLLQKCSRLIPEAGEMAGFGRLPLLLLFERFELGPGGRDGLLDLGVVRVEGQQALPDGDGLGQVPFSIFRETRLG